MFRVHTPINRSTRCWVAAYGFLRHHPHRTHELRSGSQDHHPSKNSVQKTVCCNLTSNAPDDGLMYPKHVELRIHQYNYLVTSSWHFKLFHYLYVVSTPTCFGASASSSDSPILLLWYSYKNLGGYELNKISRLKCFRDCLYIYIYIYILCICWSG